MSTFCTLFHNSNVLCTEFTILKEEFIDQAELIKERFENIHRVNVKIHFIFRIPHILYVSMSFTYAYRYRYYTQ